jgi:hypothetical protein
MGLVRLDPQVRQELEVALGRPLPAPDSPAFQALLEELEAQNPEVHRRLLDGVRVGVETPVETEVRRAAHRERWQGLLRRLFYREVYAGDPVLDKRRLLLAAFAVAALLVPVAAVMGGLSASPQSPVTRAGTSVPSSRPGRTHSPAPKPTPARSTTPSASRIAPELKPIAPSPPLPPAPLPEPNLPAAQPVPVAAEPVRLEAPTPILPAPQEPVLPDPERTPSAPITVYRSELRSEAPLTLFGTDRGEADQREAPTLAASLSPLTTASSRSAEPAEQTPSLTVYQARPTPPPSAQTTTPRAAPMPAVGARLPARLVTAVVAVSGAGVPVVAETKDATWCSGASPEACPDLIWIGEARLDTAGRVQLRFSSLTADGQSRSVAGTALGADRAPGLEAELSDLAPAAAQDLLRSALGGVGDFVRDLAERSRTTVSEGVVLPGSGAAPSLWDFLLGRAASSFALPQGQTALVRVATVSAGTALEILVLPNGDPNAP